MNICMAICQCNCCNVLRTLTLKTAMHCLMDRPILDHFDMQIDLLLP